MTLTDEQLADIQARLKAATPGPWEWWVEDYSMAVLGPENWMEDSVVTVTPCNSCSGREKDRAEKEGRTPEWQWGRCYMPNQINADFLAHAPTDIAALLAEVERLREIESEFNALVDTP